MYFFDVIGVIARRWRTVLIGALLTLAAASGAIYAVPTNYQATGQLLLLLSPIATGESTPINPFLNIDPNLTLTASLISSTISTKQEQDSVEAAGFTGDYAIALVPGVGPLIDISVEDTNPTQAIATRDEVMRRLEVELLKIQSEEDAPLRQIIHARPNSVVTKAVALPGSKIRALAAIGALGVVITMIVAFTRDRRRSSRQLRIVLPSAERDAPGADPEPGAVPARAAPDRVDADPATSASEPTAARRTAVSDLPYPDWPDLEPEPTEPSDAAAPAQLTRQ